MFIGLVLRIAVLVGLYFASRWCSKNVLDPNIFIYDFGFEFKKMDEEWWSTWLADHIEFH